MIERVYTDNKEIMFIYHLIFIKYNAFPYRSDSLLEHNKNDIQIEASGSMGFHYAEKCQMTFPNYTIIDDEKQEWCSNIGVKGVSEPWISYSIKNKEMSISGYSIRNGCCRHIDSCCSESGEKINDTAYCCCKSYGFQLQGSNDNITWTTIHTVDDKQNFYFCKSETYKLSKTPYFRLLRLVQKKEYPNSPFCMVVNQIEFYGTTKGSLSNIEEEDKSDESISIIGRIK